MDYTENYSTRQCYNHGPKANTVERPRSGEKHCKQDDYAYYKEYFTRKHQHFDVGGFGE